MKFGDIDRQVLRQLLESFKMRLSPISSMDDLWGLTDTKAEALIKKILTLNPKDFGFSGEPILAQAVPDDIVKIYDTSSLQEASDIDYDIYLPKAVFKAFERMNQAFMDENPKRKLTIDSGYRSAAYQISALLHILVKIDNFEIAKTLKRVAMPGYSQHSSVTNTAIDIGNIDLHPDSDNLEEFSNSIEYRWLEANANDFGFYESYPRNNPFGIMFEPWHWQYLGK